MKLIGAFLLLLSALVLRRALLRRQGEGIAAGEELCRALDRLHQGIYRLRRPLPELVARCREEAVLTASFWGAVETGLQARRPFGAVWEAALALLPEPYGTLLAPAALALTAGEREDLLHLTREEVYHAVQEGRRQQGERGRLVTALCLSGALLVIVVLL